MAPVEPHVDHVNDILNDLSPIWYWEVSRLGVAKLSGRGQAVNIFSSVARQLTGLEAEGLVSPSMKRIMIVSSSDDYYEGSISYYVRRT